MRHPCHAEGCARPIPPKRLFCPRHWRLLPDVTQRLIWLTYRTGQEITKSPSPAYLVAQALAVAEVAMLERLWTEQDYQKHVAKRIWSVLELLDDAALNVLGAHPRLQDAIAAIRVRRAIV